MKMAHTKTFEKPPMESFSVEPHLKNYAHLRKSYSWSQTVEELGLPRANGINLATICLDGHAPGIMERTALVWEGLQGQEERFTFQALSERTSQVAHMLSNMGIDSGDRLFLFMERTPELSMALFGGLKVGGLMSPLSPSLSSEELADHIQACEARLIFTSLSLKPKLDAIRKMCPSLERVIVVDREGSYRDPLAHEVLFHELTDAQPTTFEIATTNHDDSSLLLFTEDESPSAIVHHHGAIIAQAATGKYVLDLHPQQDIFWCTSDPSHWMGAVYSHFAPWALGCTLVTTQVPFKAESWYRVIQDFGVTVLLTEPSMLSQLMEAGEGCAKKHDLSSLRHLVSGDAPLTPEILLWGEKTFGKPIHETWGQAETGAIQLANFPSMDIKSGSVGLPIPGVEATILNANFELAADGEEGELALRPSSPSFFTAYWQDDMLYRSRQMDGWYLTGDRAQRDSNGYYWLVD